MLFYILGFGILVFFDTLAQLSFKMSALQALPAQADLAWLLRVLHTPWIYGAIAGYVGSFFTWVTLLRRVPVGPAFAASYLEVVSVLICSAWWFHERLTLARILGACLIVSGIVVLAYAESRDLRRQTEPT